MGTAAVLEVTWGTFPLVSTFTERCVLQQGSWDRPSCGAPTPVTRSVGQQHSPAAPAHLQLQDPELQELILVFDVLHIVLQASLLCFHLFDLYKKAIRLGTIFCIP